MPARERDEKERDKGSNLFQDTPCESAVPLKCTGLSSQKDYVQ